MTGPTLIELAADWPEGSAQPDRLRLGRWPALLGTLLLLLVVVAGGAAPTPPRLVELAVTDGGDEQVWIDGRTMMVAGGARVQGYDLESGARLWDVNLPGTARYSPVMYVDRILVVFEPARDAVDPGPLGTLAVIDRVTGEWTALTPDDFPIPAGPNTAVFPKRRAGVALAELIVYDLVRNAPVPVTLPPVAAWTAGGDPGTLYTLSGDAVLSEWDTRSWSVRRTVALPRRGSGMANLRVEGPVLRIRWQPADSGGAQPAPPEQADLTSLDLVTLQPVQLADYQLILDCEPVWCAYPGIEQDQLLLLDRASRQPLWRSEPGQTGLPTRAGLVISDGMEDTIGSRAQRVVDPRTGRTVRELPGWIIVNQGPLWRAMDQPAYLLQIDADRIGGRLAELTPDAELETLGRLDFTPQRCDSEGRRLACIDYAGRTHLLWVRA